jgi:hypothetical protein
MKKLIWCLTLIFCSVFGAGVVSDCDKKGCVQYKSALYNSYLRYGTLDAQEIRNYFFEGNSPEQINLALNDIRKFIERVSCGLLIHEPKKVDETYVLKILNIYGWIIRYIEKAYVMPDNRVFKIGNKRKMALPQGAVPLFAHWGVMEREKGTTLHWYKFYATAIDHLIIFIRSRLSFPCNNSERLRSRPWWMSWLTDRLQRPLVGNITYGHYYYKNVKLIEELYEAWVNEFRASLGDGEKRIGMMR